MRGRDYIRLDTEGLKEFTFDLLSIVSLVEGEKGVKVIEEDPSDNKCLSCGVAGNVDFIISGDAHLLTLRAYKGIEIVTPAQFLDVLEKAGIGHE